MPNWHALAIGAISAVNPQQIASVRHSTGYTVGAGGKQVPSYSEPDPDVSAQVQSLTFRDLVQIEGMNLNGTRRAIYLWGRYDGVVRSLMKGGDLITLAGAQNAGVWLVAQVAESWPDWSKCICTLQNDTP